MDWQEVIKSLIPMAFAAIAWLLGEVSSLNNRLIKIEGNMPILITAEGIPADSPISAERRVALKEELNKEIQDLQVRVKLAEERLERVKNSK